MMSVSKSRVVKLRSSNNGIFEVEEAIYGSAVGTDKIPSRRHRCQPCDTIARGQFQNPVMMIRVGVTKSTTSTQQLIKDWEAEFVEEVSKPTLSLISYAPQTFYVADLIKVNTVEEICELFPIKL
ncbi:unnamed protein product [Malus baccata var. baccata]